MNNSERLKTCSVVNKGWPLKELHENLGKTQGGSEGEREGAPSRLVTD